MLDLRDRVSLKRVRWPPLERLPILVLSLLPFALLFFVSDLKVALAIMGVVVAIISVAFTNSTYHRDRDEKNAAKRRDAKRCLDEAWDCLGGREGTFSISTFETDKVELERARRLIEEARNLDPLFPLVEIRCGAYLESKGLWPEAINKYRQVIQQHPEGAHAYYCLGAVLQRHNRCQEAEEAYRRAIDLSNEDEIGLKINALKSLGSIFILNNCPSKSAVLFLEALSHRPEDAEVLHNLGISYHLQDKLDLAIDSYKQALAIKPDYSKALCKMGVALFDSFKDEALDWEELEEAKGLIEEAIRIDKTSARAFLNLGVVSYKLELFEVSEYSYKEAIRLDDSMDDAYCYLGATLCMLSRCQEAKSYFQKALELNPENRSAKSNLEWINNAEDSGDIHHIANCPVFHTSGGDDLEATLSHAVTLQHHERHVESARICARVIKAYPSCARAHTLRGIALEKIGKVKCAEEAHRRAIEVDPEEVSAYSNLAHMLCRQHRDDEAIELYRAVLELDLDPENKKIAYFGLNAALRRQILHNVDSKDLLRAAEVKTEAV